MLSPNQEKIARELYGEWFSMWPNIENPSDINKKEKYEFAMSIGWEKCKLMQMARKNNLKIHNYPYPWTKPKYWSSNFKFVGFDIKERSNEVL